MMSCPAWTFCLTQQICVSFDIALLSCVFYFISFECDRCLSCSASVLGSWCCVFLLLVFYYSIIVFVHLIFLNICELSFNRNFAHCWRSFDMSNKYYLLILFAVLLDFLLCLEWLSDTTTIQTWLNLCFKFCFARCKC